MIRNFTLLLFNLSMACISIGQTAAADSSSISFHWDVKTNKIYVNKVEIPAKATMAFFDSILPYPRREVVTDAVAPHATYYYNELGIFLTLQPNTEQIASITLVMNMDEKDDLIFTTLGILGNINKAYTGSFSIDKYKVITEDDILLLGTLTECNLKSARGTYALGCGVSERKACIFLLDKTQKILQLISFRP